MSANRANVGADFHTNLHRHIKHLAGITFDSADSAAKHSEPYMAIKAQQLKVFQQNIGTCGTDTQKQPLVIEKGQY